MEWKHFLVEIRDQVARITINRPPVNTLSRDALIELGSILDQLEKDPSVRSLILTGAGEKTFPPVRMFPSLAGWGIGNRLKVS